MNNAFKVIIILAIILWGFFIILLKTYLVYGGDFFSSKNLNITGIILLGIAAIFGIVHIIELLMNKGKDNKDDPESNLGGNSSEGNDSRS